MKNVSTKLSIRLVDMTRVGMVLVDRGQILCIGISFIVIGMRGF